MSGDTQNVRIVSREPDFDRLNTVMKGNESCKLRSF